MNDVGNSGSQPVSSGTVVPEVEAPVGPAPASTLPTKESQPVELIGPSDAGPEIHPELKEIGVEAAPEQPVITDEYREAGVKLSQSPTQAAQPPRLSISEQEARDLSKGDPSRSISWLSKLILRAIAVFKFRRTKH